MKRKLSIKGKIMIFCLILIIMIIVLLCMSGNNKIKQNKKEEKKEVIEKTEEIKKLNIIDLDSDSRPIAVMINNIKNVWGYQSGLQDAYLVYEIIVEGGYTRLMAVYKDKNLERIGSVRSSRHYFLDYALENDAIYVHFGWSPQAESDMRALDVNNINFNYYKYRTTSSNKPLLNYSVDEIDLSTMKDSIVANKVFINFSNSRNTSFEYDEANKVYKRFQNDEPQIDYVTKEQYTTKNIITYQVSNSTIPKDEKGRQDINNIGTGEGYYITNGYAVPITWEKTSREGKTKYMYKDGSEINVNDGNTHIEIQPSLKELTFE